MRWYDLLEQATAACTWGLINACQSVPRRPCIEQPSNMPRPFHSRVTGLKLANPRVHRLLCLCMLLCLQALCVLWSSTHVGNMGWTGRGTWHGRMDNGAMDGDWMDCLALPGVIRTSTKRRAWPQGWPLVVPDVVSGNRIATKLQLPTRRVAAGMGPAKRQYYYCMYAVVRMQFPFYRVPSARLGIHSGDATVGNMFTPSVYRLSAWQIWFDQNPIVLRFVCFQKQQGPDATTRDQFNCFDPPPPTTSICLYRQGSWRGRVGQFPGVACGNRGKRTIAARKGTWW